MRTLLATARRVINDIEQGRYREAYALFLVGLTLVVLGLLGVVDTRVLSSTILLALSYLVFNTAQRASAQKPTLDSVLKTREDFGPFSKLLVGVRDLRIYGPTAVNVLINSADLRRFILDTGGKVRFIVQTPDPAELSFTGKQLDDNVDLGQTLQTSLTIPERLQQHPLFSYRLLPFDPGFSLVIINADSANGYVIFESHGFHDSNIADRMHIVIRRSDSSYWFLYWVSRFEEMWSMAQDSAQD